MTVWLILGLEDADGEVRIEHGLRRRLRGAGIGLRGCLGAVASLLQLEHRVARGAVAGVQVRGYVRDLYRELAACDIAVVQGGLTTTMELVAARRPFLYFPLDHHFEQQVHVSSRLDRHRAGRRMDYATANPEVIADAIATELGRTVDYLPVETDGAHRAAQLLHGVLS